MTTVGLLHPGEMGAAVGGCLASVGHTVLWDPAGRSRASTGRALAAGLEGTGFESLIAQSSVIVSVCPPHAALDVARTVADTGYSGTYVDANAVSVATAEQVAAIVTEGGASYVDGGIIGPPPENAGHTRLYLAGDRDQARKVAALFGRSPLEARVVTGQRSGGQRSAGQPFAASALKMSYAAWTKGTSALLLACRALARAEGVEDALLAEWALSQTALPDQSERAATSAALKGWRWIGEMQEIAASMARAGLPDGFHEAAAEIYDRTSRSTAPVPLRPGTGPGAGGGPASGGPGAGAGKPGAAGTGNGSLLDSVISSLT